MHAIPLHNLGRHLHKSTCSWMHPLSALQVGTANLIVMHHKLDLPLWWGRYYTRIVLCMHMHEHGMVSTDITTLVWLPYLGSISAHCRREQHIQTIAEWACTPHLSQRIPSREVQVTAGPTTGISISSKAAEFEVWAAQMIIETQCIEMDTWSWWGPGNNNVMPRVG